MKTPEEISRESRALIEELQKAEFNLLAVVRSLEPVLRDADRHHMADSLAFALSEVDRIKQEGAAFIKKHQDDRTRALLKVLDGLRGGI